MSKENEYTDLLENKKIEPYILIHDILVNWWVLLLGALAAAMLAYIAVSVRYVPSYTTSATFAVSSRSSSSSYASLSSANTMATTLQKIIESNAMQSILCDKLGVEEIDADISTRVIENTNLLELTVASDSPREAFDIMNGIIENYSSIAYYSVGDAVMDVLQEPQIPFSPSNPLNTRNTAEKAFLIAFLGLAALTALISIMRDTIKGEQEIEEKLDARNLGSISFERKYKVVKDIFQKKKNNAALLITNPLSGFSFVENYKKLAARIEYKMEEHGSKMLVVTSVSENEGKSTVAANLAISFAQKGKRVILIDGDLKRPSQFLIFGLEMEDKSELGEFLKENTDFKDVLKKIKNPNMLFIGGRNCYSSSTEILQGPQLGRLMNACRKYADYVIIDTPPAGILGDAEVFARYADEVLLVVRQNYIFSADINDTLDGFRGEDGNVLGVVLNGVKTFGNSTSLGRYGYGRYGKYGKYGKYGNYTRKQRD